MVAKIANNLKFTYIKNMSEIDLKEMVAIIIWPLSLVDDVNGNYMQAIFVKIYWNLKS